MATIFTAFHLKVKAIAALTESGSTPLWMSRINSGVPIYAMTNTEESRRKMSLYRGVYPMLGKFKGLDRDKLLEKVEEVLLENRIIEVGDFIALTIGEPIGQPGGTNTMKIVKVGDHRK